MGLFFLQTSGRTDDGGGPATEVRAAKSNQLSLPLLGGVSTDALAGELKDGGMVNQAVDRRHGRHWVFEDLVPLREHQVGGDDDRLLLIALGEEMKEDLQWNPAHSHYRGKTRGSWPNRVGRRRPHSTPCGCMLGSRTTGKASSKPAAVATR